MPRDPEMLKKSVFVAGELSESRTAPLLAYT
jgi:hypothetical protein